MSVGFAPLDAADDEDLASVVAALVDAADEVMDVDDTVAEDAGRTLSETIVTLFMPLPLVVTADATTVMAVVAPARVETVVAWLDGTIVLLTVYTRVKVSTEV